MSERPFCCRCKENSTVVEEPTRWMMGILRKLKEAPKWIQDKYNGEDYLCGNCFFELEEKKENKKP